ncbi:unnamed protein product [Clonostachys rhizophaga]|uniref:Uncharacterized protein n=1 Tax=Clonostachys rhizophaga TaxID=160324 RepID=A0A9N9VAG3_9HYPO|nr:unnamed protein product [Clonostachys rhizophaga]
MRPRDDITTPFSGYGEDNLEAPEHRPAADEIMVDADDDIHSCIGVTTDVDVEWEIDGDLMGKEVIDGEVYYLVPWKPTLVPATMMQSALELINRFEARFGAQTSKSVEGARVANKIATSQKPSQHGKDMTARRLGRYNTIQYNTAATSFSFGMTCGPYRILTLIHALSQS